VQEKMMDLMATEKEKDVEWGKRLLLLREDRHLSQKKLVADGIGISLPTIQRYEAGQLPSGKSINKIIAFFKCSKAWLLTGTGVPYPNEFKGEYEAPGAYHQPISEEFVFIKQVNGKISAGGGLLPDDSIDMRLAFRREWLKVKGNPDNMSLIRVQGDSMNPTLMPGDLVLVDHSRTDIPSQGGIYAISIDHEILIKRLQLLYSGGKIMIISDNKQYPSQDIEAEKIIINGKVIWYARELEK